VEEEESYTSRLRGGSFLENEVTDNIAERGGGIFIVSNSSPLISVNTINGNLASDAAGVYVARNSNPTISGNTFSNNIAEDEGGGIYVTEESSPAIENNLIELNTAGSAAGIYVSGSSSPNIAENNIISNTSEFFAGGILVSSSSAPSILDNIIEKNVANQAGGIFVEGQSSVEIAGNRVNENIGHEAAGGIAIIDGSFALLVENEVTNNDSGLCAGIVINLGASPSAADLTIVVRENKIAGNTSEVGGGLCVLGFSVVSAAQNEFSSNEGGPFFLAPDATLATSQPDDNIYHDN